MIRAALLWGPVLAWMGVIFAASSVSLPPGGGSVPDWITHPAVYAVLSLLACRAAAGGWRRPLSGARLAAVVALVTLYGLSDELHQALVPGRDASAWDVAKDFAGALLAALAYARAERREEEGGVSGARWPGR